jgi:hypothetical protein
MILSVSLVIVFLAISSNYFLVFAQIPGIVNTPPSNQQQQSQPATTTTAAESTNYTNYKDPQGRFSIDYPSTWHANPATNRFQSNLVSFNYGLAT